MPGPPFEALYEVLDGLDHRSNRWGLELTLDELARRRQFSPVDAAEVQALRMMASACDLETTNAALWREYRAALADVLGRDADDSLEAELARFDNLSASVRH